MRRNDLSLEAKQTFQILAMLATILVVGIHYKSDIPNVAELSGSTWNELAQEYFFGGLARVAVPLFAFAAGLFYFRSDDGSFASYQKKTKQRVRTVLVPYLLIGFIATTSLMLVKQIEGEGSELSAGGFLASWLLRPPAEQLWFLRDLMVLVLIAPAIRLIATQDSLRLPGTAAIGLAWFFNWQLFPVVEGWYLLNMETLLFFLLGAIAVSYFGWIEAIGRTGNHVFFGLLLTWVLLVGLRVAYKPNFDIWYTNQWTLPDLFLHQVSILVGCVALFAVSWRLRFDSLLFLSGASFFVYLVHEFPLRAVAEKIVVKVVPESISCWFVTPIVVVGCYSMAIVLFKLCPTLTGILTGGRGPTMANPSKEATALPRQLGRTYS